MSGFWNKIVAHCAERKRYGCKILFSILYLRIKIEILIGRECKTFIA